MAYSLLVCSEFRESFVAPHFSLFELLHRNLCAHRFVNLLHRVCIEAPARVIHLQNINEASESVNEGARVSA